MEIYVIRHGKTFWNDKNLAQGSVDIELNEDGTFRYTSVDDPGYNEYGIYRVE